MTKIRTILVGGFLGAGKTTLIAAATERLASQGNQVGVITNDQAANLVDSASLLRPGLALQEVAGGCFCCRFDDLVGAMDRIAEAERPDFLIGEPVGSCTDISATVLQPMKQLLADRYDLAPFSVLVDATQLRDALRSNGHCRFPENVLYIYRKQLEEADVIVISKTDLVAPSELEGLEEVLRNEFPGTALMSVSTTEGRGVDGWLDYVTNTSGAGERITEVDYDTYAEGEAALGWLNASVGLRAGETLAWDEFCRTFMESMRSEFGRIDAEVAHLKLHLTSDGGTLTANLTSNRDQPSIRGRITRSSPEAHLLVNARAHVDSERLRTVTETCLVAAAGDSVRMTINELSHFAPARPTPTHRFGSVFDRPEL